MLPQMSKYDWLLFLHVTGGFFLVGGAVTAACLNIAAQFRQRPSEIALLLRLTQVAVVVIIAGSLLTVVFGLWLVDAAPYGYRYGQGWVIAALVLWLVGNVLGNVGGQREGKTHKLAKRLAAEGDRPSAELKARLRDPIALFLNYGAGLAVLAVLAIMIWKPGT
jgi:uncharacterized membrane protein